MKSPAQVGRFICLSRLVETPQDKVCWTIGHVEFQPIAARIMTMLQVAEAHIVHVARWQHQAVLSNTPVNQLCNDVPDSRPGL